jgi:acyl-CoA reductase-like NAD-dependent aldehyde dehydrogenase
MSALSKTADSGPPVLLGINRKRFYPEQQVHNSSKQNTAGFFMTMESINPATGKTIATYNSMDDATVDKIVEQMQSARNGRKPAFRFTPSLLHKAAAVLRNRQNELAADRELVAAVASQTAEPKES